MPDGGHTSDGKASLCAHQGCVCFAQCFACQGGGLVGIDRIAACGQEQDRSAGCLAAKDDGFGDLVDLAFQSCGGVGCRACQWGFADFGIYAGCLKCGADTFQTFAHERMIEPERDGVQVQHAAQTPLTRRAEHRMVRA